MRIACKNVQNRSHEDFWNVSVLGSTECYTVIDGHGNDSSQTPISSQHVAVYCQEHLSKHILDAVDSGESLVRTVSELDEHLHASGAKYGCAFASLVRTGDEAVLVSLGDCRAVVFEGTNILARTIDHKPENEIHRIERAGGFIARGRVNGVLMMSRALGDFDLKAVNGKFSPEGPVSSIPSVVRVRLPQSCRFAIFTDGVSDVLSDEEVVSICLQSGDNLEEAASKIVDIARGDTDDDVTCMIGKM